MSKIREQRSYCNLILFSIFFSAVSGNLSTALSFAFLLFINSEKEGIAGRFAAVVVELCTEETREELMTLGTSSFMASIITWLTEDEAEPEGSCLGGIFSGRRVITGSEPICQICRIGC